MAWGDYFGAAHGSTGTANTLSLSEAASTPAGSYQVAGIYRDPGNTVTSVPSGWELIREETNAGDLILAIYGGHRSQTGSGPWVWQFSASTFRFGSVWVLPDAGGTASSRLDGSTSAATGDSALNSGQTVPSVTTAVNNSQVVSVFASFGGTTVTSFGGFTSNFRSQNNGMALATALKSPAGATGVSGPPGGTGTENFVIIQFALLETTTSDTPVSGGRMRGAQRHHPKPVMRRIAA